MPISLRVSLLERETTFSFFKQEMFPSAGDTFETFNCYRWLSTTGIYHYLSRRCFLNTFHSSWIHSVQQRIWKSVMCLLSKECNRRFGRSDSRCSWTWVYSWGGRNVTVVLWNIIAKRNFMECIGTMWLLIKCMSNYPWNQYLTIIIWGRFV